MEVLRSNRAHRAHHAVIRKTGYPDTNTHAYQIIHARSILIQVLTGVHYQRTEIPGLRPLLDVRRAGADRVVRGSKVALVERAHLVGLERTNDRVQHAAVMEEHEVLLVPVVRIHELLLRQNSVHVSASWTRTLGAMAGRCIL